MIIQNTLWPIHIIWYTLNNCSGNITDDSLVKGNWPKLNNRSRIKTSGFCLEWGFLMPKKNLVYRATVLKTVGRVGSVVFVVFLELKPQL